MTLAAVAVGAALLTAPHRASPSATGGPAVAEASFGDYRPAPAFTERVTESFYLPMRDGTRLAVRLDRPAVGGKPAPGLFPVLWHHSMSIDSKPEDGAGPEEGGFSAGADHRASAPLPDARDAHIEVLTGPARPSLVHLPITPA